MCTKPALRRVLLVVAAAGALPASPTNAQEWSVYAGAAGRVEYNDNYYFVVPGQTDPGNPGSALAKQSAITLSLLPFVAASRRTEVSDVTALVAIGANEVMSISPSESFLSGRFALDGSFRGERSTWTGRASYSRSSSLEQAIANEDVVLVRTYTDAATLEGLYNYQLTDRWTIGASAGGYANWYDSVQSTDSQSNDWGYNVIGNLGYAYSDHTRITYTLGYTYYASDITRSNVLTTTIGVVHRISPQLTVSGSAGGFWSNTRARQNLPGQGTPIAAGEDRDDSGTLLGGSILYALSENTQFDIRASQGLSPSGSGAITESTSASVSLLHQFSDRLSGRLAAGYSRTSYLDVPRSVAGDTTIAAGAGPSYRLADRWMLDAGYTYNRARYPQQSGEPASNIVFVSLGYNWPGASFTGWVGSPVQSQGLPAAGPLSLPETQRGISGGTPQAPSSQPFDSFTLP